MGQTSCRGSRYQQQTTSGLVGFKAVTVNAPPVESTTPSTEVPALANAGSTFVGRPPVGYDHIANWGPECHCAMNIPSLSQVCVPPALQQNPPTHPRTCVVPTIFALCEICMR